jgi:hypothetical protein
LFRFVTEVTFTVLRLQLSLPFLNLLKIFQGYFTVQLSRFFVVVVFCFSATTRLYYHSVACLSTTFFIFFLRLISDILCRLPPSASL